ncbi:MAG: hypothetical protein QW590_00095 [Candidatus Bilamarchaeaceae archaeon]
MRELSKAFALYTDKPFLFMWGSVLYVFFILLFFLSALGIVMLTLIISFLADYPLTYDSPVVIGLGLILFIYLVYFTGGITAAMVLVYKNAMRSAKTSLLDFYNYLLSKAPVMFGITLMREVFTALAVGGVGGLLYYLGWFEYEYVDVLFAVYALGVVFLMRLIAMPAIITCGLGEKSTFEAFRMIYVLITKRHIYFLITFALFSLAWVLNLIPIVQFISLFCIFPIAYAALIEMVLETK